MRCPLISIIVPCYNVEKYLPKCIESIINQTYKNLEIFLVDDGSPDNSGKICDEYAAEDERIKVIHKENGGLSDARNVAIDKATGEYILFIDSDDYVALNHVEHLYGILERADADIAVEWGQTFYEGTMPVVDTQGDKKEIILEPDDALVNMFYQEDFDTCAWAKLYKRSLFDGIRYPKGWLYEDLPTTYRLIQKCKKVVFSDYKSYYYLLRNSSIEGAPFKPLKYESCIKIINQLEHARINMPGDVQKALDCRIVSFAFHILLEIPDSHKDMRNSLFDIIKVKRKKVLLASKANKKVRIACLFSYFGMWYIRIFSKLGKSR